MSRTLHGLLGAVIFAYAGIAMAGDLNGKWEAPIGPGAEYLNINNGIAHFVAACGPAGMGSFHARISQDGDRVTVHAPYIAPTRTVYGHYSPFTIHFVQHGNKLTEVAPFPSGGKSAIGFWHGMGCSFGLSSNNGKGLYYVKNK